jgi:hypothetical protein
MPNRLTQGGKSAHNRPGYTSVLVRLKIEQATALRREALRRAAEAGTARADVSALVREAIDLWLEKHR